MRLIDADLIPTEISFDPKENKAFRDVIDEQPNVPAIPLSFIRKEFKYLSEEEQYAVAKVVESWASHLIEGVLEKYGQQ